MLAWDPETHQRLSDRVLEALNLALTQEDLDIAGFLVKTLELAMTRGAGGADFVERRDYSDELDAAMDKFHELKIKMGA